MENVPNEFPTIVMDDDSEEELEDENAAALSSSEESEEEDEVPIGFRCRRTGDFGGVLSFTAPHIDINKTAAPHINADLSPLSIFSLFFFEEIFSLLVVETNKYCQQYYASRGVPGPSVESVVISIEEIQKFIALVIPMGHDLRDSFKDYWSKDEQYHTPFYQNTMPRDRFMHILRFLHFSDNNNRPIREDENYDRLWKIREVFDTLNNKFHEFYFPSEYIAVDEVIVSFKGRGIFRQYIPKKT